MTTSGRIFCDTRKQDLVSFLMLIVRCVLTKVVEAFIRGLLENVGAEIDPIRLIRRIKNGLEIPGLKGALIKILHDFNLQVSLLEGCQTILNGDCSDFVQKLHRNQTSGFFLSGKCSRLLRESVSDSWTSMTNSEDALSDLQQTNRADTART